MGLTKGNFQGQQMQGLTDEQQREQQRGLIMIQLRRHLRLFWIGATVLNIIYTLFTGHDTFTSTIVYGIAMGAIGYAITVFLLVYVIANWTIKTYLYLRSLFGGAARL